MGDASMRIPLHRRPGAFVASRYAALSNRLGDRLLAEVIAAPSLRPRLTLPKALAYLFAAWVHLITVLTIAAGMLAIAWLRNVVGVVIGLGLLLFAYELRPRVAKYREVTMPPEQLVHLHGLTGRIAAHLGMSNVDAVAINGEWNASMGRYGWRRRKVLTIGLPLFDALGAQERVALLGHELAHAVNGDSTRGLIVGSAIYSLITWRDVLRPTYARPGIVERIGGAVMRLVSYLPAAGLWLLARLSWHESQRAEYLADALGARLAGRQAAVSTLHTLEQQPIFATALHQLALNRESGDLFAKARARLLEVPRRRVVRPSRYRIEGTHPPTAFRLEFIASRPDEPPEILLTETENRALSEELAAFAPEVQKRLVERYLRRMYR